MLKSKNANWLRARFFFFRFESIARGRCRTTRICLRWFVLRYMIKAKNWFNSLWGFMKFYATQQTPKPLIWANKERERIHIVCPHTPNGTDLQEARNSECLSFINGDIREDIRGISQNMLDECSLRSSIWGYLSFSMCTVNWSQPGSRRSMLEAYAWKYSLREGELLWLELLARTVVTRISSRIDARIIGQTNSVVDDPKLTQNSLRTFNDPSTYNDDPNQWMLIAK